MVVIGVALVTYYVLIINRYAIGDWYFLRTYTPPAQVAQLASQADLTPTGRRLFYRANPQIVTTRAAMVRHCNISDNQVAELGCYLSTEHIYLLEVSEPALHNEMAVTAAYEMLHSVYQRMGAGERARVDAEMAPVATHITDPNILSQLQIYAKTEPGEQNDELYSVLGTEYPTIPSDLASNYSHYLGDRAQLVGYHSQFEQAFDGLQNQITQLGSQIAQTRAGMQHLLAIGDVEQYNAMVAGVNTQITQYNNEVNEYNRYGQDILGTESGSQEQ
jgi:hypothetical protein